MDYFKKAGFEIFRGQAPMSRFNENYKIANKIKEKEMAIWLYGALEKKVEWMGDGWMDTP